jgi:hypothetical protein
MINQTLINQISIIDKKYSKKNGRLRAIEFERIIPDDLLMQEYIVNKKRIHDISIELGITGGYIKKRLSKITILRTPGESYKKELNSQWKGDNVGIKGLHKWIKTYKPKPTFCENCNKIPPYELANISQEYYRDINDFRWLCRSCHSKEHRGTEWNIKMNEIRWQNKE